MDVILRKRDDVVFRKIDDEYILVPMAASSEEVESIFNLNATGAIIWEKIDGERRIKDIVDEIQSEYDAEADQLGKDVVAFINELMAARLVTAV
jgi:hypothetical protein